VLKVTDWSKVSGEIDINIPASRPYSRAQGPGISVHAATDASEPVNPGRSSCF
jgi:hypothetical protein